MTTDVPRHCRGGGAESSPLRTTVPDSVLYRRTRCCVGVTKQRLWTGCQERPLKRWYWDMEEKRGQVIQKAGEGIPSSRTGESKGSEVRKSWCV